MSEQQLTSFACPFCHAELDVRLPRVSKVVPCPGCAKPIKLPARDPEPEPLVVTTRPAPPEPEIADAEPPAPPPQELADDEDVAATEEAPEPPTPTRKRIQRTKVVTRKKIPLRSGLGPNPPVQEPAEPTEEAAPPSEQSARETGEALVEEAPADASSSEHGEANAPGTGTTAQRTRVVTRKKTTLRKKTAPGLQTPESAVPPEETEVPVASPDPAVEESVDKASADAASKEQVETKEAAKSAKQDVEADDSVSPGEPPKPHAAAEPLPESSADSSTDGDTGPTPPSPRNTVRRTQYANRRSPARSKVASAGRPVSKSKNKKVADAGTKGDEPTAEEPRDLIRMVKASQKQSKAMLLWTFLPMCVTGIVAGFVIANKKPPAQAEARISIGTQAAQSQGQAPGTSAPNSATRTWRATAESEVVGAAFGGRRGGEILDMVTTSDSRFVATGVFASSHAVPHGRVKQKSEYFPSEADGGIAFIAGYSGDRSRTEWIVTFGPGVLEPLCVAVGRRGQVVLAARALNDVEGLKKGHCGILKFSTDGSVLDWVKDLGDVPSVRGLSVNRSGSVFWIAGGPGASGYVLE